MHRILHSDQCKVAEEEETTELFISHPLMSLTIRMDEQINYYVCMFN